MRAATEKAPRIAPGAFSWTNPSAEALSRRGRAAIVLVTVVAAVAVTVGYESIAGRSRCHSDCRRDVASDMLLEPRKTMVDVAHFAGPRPQTVAGVAWCKTPLDPRAIRELQAIVPRCGSSMRRARSCRFPAGGGRCGLQACACRDDCSGHSRTHRPWAGPVTDRSGLRGRTGRQAGVATQEPRRQRREKSLHYASWLSLVEQIDAACDAAPELSSFIDACNAVGSNRSLMRERCPLSSDRAARSRRLQCLDLPAAPEQRVAQRAHRRH